MIVDTSAFLSVVFREPGFESLIEQLTSAERLAAGTPTLAETGIVLRARLGTAADGLLERLPLLFVADDFAQTDLTISGLSSVAAAAPPAP